MANPKQYRGASGRFERCTVQKLFGIQTNEKGNKYCCLHCGHIFAPIIESGRCVKCQSTEIRPIKED